MTDPKTTAASAGGRIITDEMLGKLVARFKEIRSFATRMHNERDYEAADGWVRDLESLPSAKAERMFPMQDGPAIPWALAEIIWKGYAECGGYDQPLERVGERGGFGWAEVAHFWSKPRARRAMQVAASDRQADR